MGIGESVTWGVGNTQSGVVSLGKSIGILMGIGKSVTWGVGNTHTIWGGKFWENL